MESIGTRGPFSTGDGWKIRAYPIDSTADEQGMNIDDSFMVGLVIGLWMGIIAGVVFML